MKIRVQYSAQLRAAVGCREEDVELPAGSGLRDLLDKLAQSGGDVVRTHLWSGGSTIRPSLIVVLNSVAIPVDRITLTRLNEADIVMLLPPISGG